MICFLMIEGTREACRLSQSNSANGKQGGGFTCRAFVMSTGIRIQQNLCTCNAERKAGSRRKSAKGN